VRLSSVRGARYKRAAHAGAALPPSYWARGTHGRRRSLWLNTHRAACVEGENTRARLPAAPHFIPYTDVECCTNVLCGLRCDGDNKPFPLHHRYTTRARRSSSECGDSPSALPRPLPTPLSDGVLGGRACPLAPPGSPTRWSATSCRSKAALHSRSDALALI